MNRNQNIQIKISEISSLMEKHFINRNCQLNPRQIVKNKINSLEHHWHSIFVAVFRMKTNWIRDSVTLSPQSQALITFYLFERTLIKSSQQQVVYCLKMMKCRRPHTHTIIDWKKKDQSRCDRASFVREKDALIDIHKRFFLYFFVSNLCSRWNSCMLDKIHILNLSVDVSSLNRNLTWNNELIGCEKYSIQYKFERFTKNFNRFNTKAVVMHRSTRFKVV